ncbi:MAG: A/G-specific adenine glycosylase [Candidatus Korobacteraceae bacterium]|jgi:A/G-specific adenine glycosylase
MTETQEPKSPGALQAALRTWYAKHKRELPWRRDSDAYRVWVSEIMLQQTRVAAVLEHYRLFLEAFPTVEALALAPEERVLALWSGLGYYRRARMLHQAAKVVMTDFGGVIPREAESLRMLPGVGRYTAAAIASIAYGEPVAVVDGNVERVLSRIDGEPRSDAVAWKRAQELLDRRHPGDWNQAMMELGATLCTPRNPQCKVCPLLRWCRAPGAETRKPQQARKRVRMTRALIERSHRVYLVQRAADAAKMAGMWELPEYPAEIAQQSADAKPGQSVSRANKELCVVRHSITDTDYQVRVLRLDLKALGAGGKRSGRWVKFEEIDELPLTGLTRKILRKLGLR